MTALRRNNVKLSGTGEAPMPFAHGFGCEQHGRRWVTPAIEHSRRAVLFDHVGTGASDHHAACGPLKHRTLTGQAGDLPEIRAEPDLHDTIFVGHPVSSMIGELAALRGPRQTVAAIQAFLGRPAAARAP